MILRIVPDLLVDKYNKDNNPKVYSMDYKTFNSLEVHPMIATTPWERIEVVISKGIRAGYIKQVLTKCNIVEAEIFEEDTTLDYEVVARLGEVFPTKSAELRGAFMKKQGLRELLVEAGVQFV